MIRKIVSVVAGAGGLLVGAAGMTVPAFVATPYFIFAAIAFGVAYVAWPKQPKVIIMRQEDAS